jgi:hypothetical protein
MLPSSFSYAFQHQPGVLRGDSHAWSSWLRLSLQGGGMTGNTGSGMGGGMMSGTGGNQQVRCWSTGWSHLLP